MSQPLHILIVDDDPDMRIYLAQCLRGAIEPRLQVEEAPNGEAALACLAGARFDLVVSDARMPRLDGLGLCRVLDADRSRDRLPVLLVTGETDLVAEIRAYISGRRDRGILFKPFNTRTLHREVATLLAAGPTASGAQE